MAAALAEGVCQLLLCVAELLHQQSIGPGFFERIEVGALDVLDEGDFQRLAVAQFADEHGYVMNAGPLGGAPAAFAGHDFVLAASQRPDDDGLEQSLVADRACQILEITLGEVLARIVGTRLQQVNGHVAQGAHVLHYRFFAGVIADQCGQSAAKSLLGGAGHVHLVLLSGSGQSLRGGIVQAARSSRSRRMISEASRI